LRVDRELLRRRGLRRQSNLLGRLVRLRGGYARLRRQLHSERELLQRRRMRRESHVLGWRVRLRVGHARLWRHVHSERELLQRRRMRFESHVLGRRVCLRVGHARLWRHVHSERELLQRRRLRRRWSRRSGGACVCAAGTRVCGAVCIPTGTCCSSADCSAPLTCPSPGSACACPATARMPIYRFHRTSNNDHVYSISATELSGVSGWISEGIRFYTYPEPCPSGMLRLLRFVNTSNNQHFYTSDAAEAAGLPANVVPEGAIGCVATSTVCGSTPLFRKLTCSGGHFYSTDRTEFDAMCGSDEGSVGEAWLSM
jgi:hypothetical protein